MAAERSSAETVAAGGKEPGRRLYFGRETATLALLVLLAIVGFAGVSGLSRIYHAQQEALGNRWFTRGAADLKEQHFDRAVSEFRTALLYSRDNYSYQLNLAEALIGLKRSSEAYAYLLNLWEREPENGRVNLELARIAAQRKLTEEALRYYHNTIYATWASDQEVERKNARLELIEFLLGNNDKTQAQSELIALAANLDDDPGEHARAGDLFLRIGDDEHALAEYRLGLNEERRDPAVLAGAGRAAFELRQYTLAERYLQEAVSANASDTQSAQLLSTATLVVKMDPFRRQISVAERSRIVGEAFATAGQRLKSCFDAGAAGGQSSLGQEWEKLKGQITEAGLRRNPDLVEVAMELVFRIERQSSAACGLPTGTDLALLLIAKLHERN